MPERSARILAVAAAAALAVAAVAPGAAAGEGPGTRAVRRANQVISQLLRKKVPKGSPAETKLAGEVTTRVRSFLDIDELGKRALVDHWKTLTPAQRAKFMSLLKALIEKNYVKGLREDLDYQVEYTGESVKGEHRVVTTQIHTRRHGHPYTVGVDYVLLEDGGHWRAYDVVTDGVGLVENYRSQFNQIIAKRGFDGLLKLMEKKRDEMGK